MPQYRIVFSYKGELLPERFDRKPFQVTDGNDQYELSRALSRTSGQFLQLNPVHADDPNAAYAKAFRVVNGCLNRLCLECNHRAALEPGFFFENLDDRANRGSRGLVQVLDCGVGLVPFPELIATDGGRRSAAFFRRAQIENDPVDRCRYFSLAIEEAAKRIKAALKINKGAEGDVIRYTILEVFKKTSGLDHLKDIRNSIRNDFFSDQFRDGKNSAEAAVSDFLYQHVRCVVMHAGSTAKKGTKEAKDTYAPFDPDDWRKASEVLPAVEEVARLYVTYDLGLRV